MSRKLSIDSVSDSAADDLLRALLHQAFRQPTVWGWITNTAFAVASFSIAVLCWADSKAIGGAVFSAVAAATIAARLYILSRNRTPEDPVSPDLRRRAKGSKLQG